MEFLKSTRFTREGQLITEGANVIEPERSDQETGGRGKKLAVAKPPVTFLFPVS